MKIRHRMLLGFLPIAALAVAAMTLLSQRIAREVLVREVVRRGLDTGLDRVGTAPGVSLFRTGEESQLLPLLQELSAATGALYAMVLAADGRVLAHTNVVEKGKRYDDDLTRRAIGSQEPVHAWTRMRGQPLVDVAFPVWEVEERLTGEEFLLVGRSDVRGDRRLATVRMGLPLEETLETAEQISSGVLWTISFGSLLMALLGSFHVRRLLQPLQALARAAERIGGGRVGETVPEGSNDELGELAASFNQMSRDLAGTTVSRDFLDSVLRNMQDCLLVTDTQGTIRLCNRRAARLLGRGESDLHGLNVAELFVDGRGPVPRDPGAEDVASMETTLRTAGGDPVPVLLGVTAFGEGEHEGAGYVLTATDFTERKQAEARIRASLEEKSLLLKEIHHRVKNNLQIISSLLSLQARQIDDAETLQMFANSQDRITSMALIHERLYRSDELARVDFADYIRELTESLFKTYRVHSARVQLHLEVDSVLLEIDEAIPCGLIINELVLNALKHAFPEPREGTLTLVFGRQPEGDHLLVVRDDGVGLPPDLDPERVESLGMRLVTVLVGQLHGRLEVDGSDGTEYRIRFPGRS